MISQLLKYIPIAHPQSDFGRVGDHADDVAMNTAIDRLSDECLEPRADLPRRQVTGSGDKFHPERHGPLTTIAQLQHRAAWNRAVVDVAEHTHLVQVQYHFELCG